ncbi:MAG: hypothetical protein IKE65_01565 [Clostridia bacterium]|nr:hypothetical protein [Clostridia bacterium]
MREVKTTLKRMAFYYFLLALNIIPGAQIIPDRFPLRNISVVYLLSLCVALILYYSHRVSRSGGLSAMMKALSWMALLLILLRGIKYSVFAEVGILARHTWYLYYVPMLLLPLFLFYISILVSPKEDFRLSKGWYFVLALTILMIVLVLSNDMHQLVFRFAPDFADWDNEYSYGFLFYVITVWKYLLYVAAIAILLIKCRISSAKKHAWVILIPVVIGIILSLLLVTGKMPRINGSNFIEVPENSIFTVAIVLECCMQLGLIPTNSDYGKLFRQFSIAAQITDKKGTAVYSSYAATPLSARQFAMESGTRIGEHTLLHKMKIPGGFGFWQDDMSALDNLNEELAEAKEELAQEVELIRLRNELKEKQTKIEQRTLVYDTIAERTKRQSQEISRLARTAQQTTDSDLKEEYKGRITLLGAYIKRYANLMLLSHDSNLIEVGELGLSVSEVLYYLNYCGIPGEFFGGTQAIVRADAALIVFEAFETLLETNFSHLAGVFVNLNAKEKVFFKLTLENMRLSLPQELARQLCEAGVNYEINQEDDITYMCFTLPKGGETL